MNTVETELSQKRELHTKLWKMANSLRGNMDANEFKDYILGLIFYRYISEHEESEFQNKLHSTVEEFFKVTPDQCREMAIINLGLGYFIEPDYLFKSLVKKISIGSFELENLATAFKNYSDSTKGQESEDQLSKLFNDVNLTSDKLGSTYKEKGELIAKLIMAIDEINFDFMNSKIDLLGDAYEYLIGQFAASAGKKAGEFYTPQQVSKILAKIVTLGKTRLKNVYDPTCGSGSLLLRVSKEAEVGDFYGQELNQTTYNLARMNMILHGVKYGDFDIKQGDSLEYPMHIDKKFEAIVANPPFSAKWSSDKEFLDDERFSAYGKLAPKSKADYAFVQHMIYHLDENGTMAVVLPHGVLFRGAAEGKIRRYLIEEKNYLDAVIGLPANLFYGTSIPTCILVFKKCRTSDDDILFIDASKYFEKAKNQNVLRDEDIERIVSTYSERKEVEKFSHCASMDEIEENDFNLNIPRYVDTFEEEEPIDLDEVCDELEKIAKEMEEVDREIKKYCDELGIRAPIF